MVSSRDRQCCGKACLLTSCPPLHLRHALLRDHCAALVEALLPIAAAADAAAAVEPAGADGSGKSTPSDAAAAEATKLLEMAIKALPDSAWSTLPVFPRTRRFAILGAACERARTSTPLHVALSQFGRLDEADASGSMLTAQLADLHQRLVAARVATSSAESLHRYDGETATVATAAATRLLLLCRSEADGGWRLWREPDRGRQPPRVPCVPCDEPPPRNPRHPSGTPASPRVPFCSAAHSPTHPRAHPRGRAADALAGRVPLAAPQCLPHRAQRACGRWQREQRRARCGMGNGIDRLGRRSRHGRLLPHRRPPPRLTPTAPRADRRRSQDHAPRGEAPLTASLPRAHSHLFLTCPSPAPHLPLTCPSPAPHLAFTPDLHTWT